MMAVCLYKTKHMMFTCPSDRTEMKKDRGTTIRRRMTAGQFRGKRRKQAPENRQKPAELHDSGSAGFSFDFVRLVILYSKHVCTEETEKMRKRTFILATMIAALLTVFIFGGSCAAAETADAPAVRTILLWAGGAAMEEPDTGLVSKRLNKMMFVQSFLVV